MKLTVHAYEIVKHEIEVDDSLIERWENGDIESLYEEVYSNHYTGDGDICRITNTSTGKVLAEY